MPLIHRTTDPPPLHLPEDDLPGPIWLLILFVVGLGFAAAAGMGTCAQRPTTVELKP